MVKVIENIRERFKKKRSPDDEVYEADVKEAKRKGLAEARVEKLKQIRQREKEKALAGGELGYFLKKKVAPVAGGAMSEFKTLAKSAKKKQYPLSYGMGPRRRVRKARKKKRGGGYSYGPKLKSFEEMVGGGW